MSEASALGNRTDLPSWAAPHWPALLLWQLAGIPPEEQIRLLRTQGLTPERALRLALAVPPRTPHGQRQRVRLGARLLHEEPRRFWPVVESLQLYWGIHPWSLLGEGLPVAMHGAWCRELGCSGSPQEGLRFSGAFGNEPALPPALCASRIQVDQLPLVRLPKGWIVDDLVLSNCPRLRGSLAEVTVLQTSSISRCPLFEHEEALELRPWRR